MNYKLAVYGDSIAFGYGCGNQSWFDYFSVDTPSIKLAQNGEKIADVLNKIKKDSNHYSQIILAVGINDLLQTSPREDNLPLSSLISQYSDIIKTASCIADKIIVQSVLPVRENLFPDQDWLDDKKWAFNENICKFNKALKNICIDNQVNYIDAYSRFSQLCLANLYVDAVHLNEAGQRKLYEIYAEQFG